MFDFTTYDDPVSEGFIYAVYLMVYDDDVV